MIDWFAFDWQSFSTLTTGGLAVLAAYAVGQKQTDIQRRQTAIQEESLRSVMFDKRFSVFERTEQFLREILQRADDPDPETQREFIIASGESRFLFNDDVREGLDEIWRKWSEFHALKVTMNHKFKTLGHYGQGNPENERVLLDWFSQRFRSLPDLFDELKLGRPLSNN